MGSMTRGIAEHLASDIELWIRQEQLAEGTPLPERALADRFKVSRTPVREALQTLAQRHVVSARPEGGFAVKGLLEGRSLLELLPADDHEPVYSKIAEDRLTGRLPNRTTENELMRRYDLTRARLGAVLRRIVSEGWIERLPGKGWRFLPVLGSSSAYDQGYRLRILLEPAAILEPMYELDESALRKCRAEQQALADGAAEWATPAQLFNSDARLHETITTFSGNHFMIDALRRVNRLRRLMEYHRTVDRVAAARRCKEHLTLIDLLLSSQREAAADFMRLHLREAARERAGGMPDVHITSTARVT